MRAGSVAALSAIADRDLSQAWSRHLYASHAIDGFLYSSGHSSESEIALYDRADAAIGCIRDLALDVSMLLSGRQSGALLQGSGFFLEEGQSVSKVQLGRPGVR